ncbi:response regulator [Marinobacter shengliensis]|uniref:response regulator n=1 Tax=Marinobacter shengliensis TaxID=1389223 RepID=UPI000D0FD5B5|nr:response regulator [Marinobacter shengliensis]PSF14713.1 response regulator [Marinobacter shengliensis]
MNVLVLEDDELVAELLETVIAGSYPGARVRLTGTLAQALAKVDTESFDLVVADWNLPDGSGLELVRQVRRRDSEVPLVMVSGRADRDSVLKAAHYGISGYITKPFSVEILHQRLAELLTSEGQYGRPDLETMLKSGLERSVQLPGDQNPEDILELIERADQLSAAQLAERWREKTALVTRFLDVANGSSFRRTGKPVETVKDAITLLGVPMALNLALALSLDVSRKFHVSVLVELAAGFQDTASHVGREAQRLAITLKHSPVMYQKAGLLSRVGELAVLHILNQFASRGGEVSAELARRCLKEWAQPYGNRLKVQWRLPLGLRDMIGAVHFLPRDSTREERLIMRAAALMAEGQERTEECRRLLRRLGLDDGTGNSAQRDKP